MESRSHDNNKDMLSRIKSEVDVSQQTKELLDSNIDRLLVSRERSRRKARRTIGITLPLYLLLIGGLITACYYILRNIENKKADIDDQFLALSKTNATLMTVTSRANPKFSQTAIQEFLNNRYDHWEYLIDNSFTTPTKPDEQIKTCHRGLFLSGTETIKDLLRFKMTYADSRAKGYPNGDCSGLWSWLEPDPYWNACIKIVTDFCKEVNDYKPYRIILADLGEIKSSNVGVGFLFAIIALLSIGETALLARNIVRNNKFNTVEDFVLSPELEQLQSMCHSLGVQYNSDPEILGLKLLIKKSLLSISSILKGNSVTSADIQQTIANISDVLKRTSKLTPKIFVNTEIFVQAESIFHAWIKTAFHLYELKQCVTAEEMLSLCSTNKNILANYYFDESLRFQVFRFIYMQELTKSDCRTAAFLMALPSCERNGQLICFNDESKQREFDGYLTQAANTLPASESGILSTNQRKGLIANMKRPFHYLKLPFFREQPSVFAAQEVTPGAAFKP